MKKITLFSLLALFAALPAQAVCPSMTQNPEREAKTLTDQIKEGLSEMYQHFTEDAEDKQKEAQSGNQDCSKAPKNTKAPTNKAYDYLKKEVLSKTRDETDDYLPRTKDYATAREQVKKTFFVKPAEQLTERGESLAKATGIDMAAMGGGLTTTVQTLEILIKRDDYANAVASKNLEISAKLRENVLEDLKSVKQAASEGCNQLQGRYLENRNLGSLVAVTAADIIVQILTMEAIAVRSMQKEGIQLIPLPKKPTYDKKN